MASCEMCGADSNSLFSVQVAGSFMKVCNSCKGAGVETKATSNKAHTFRRSKRSSDGSYDVISNYSQLIQSELSKRGWNLHQLARATNIKESSLNNFMKQTIKLDVETARKIGRFLEVDLVYECSNDSDVKADDFMSESSSAGLSLGDLIQKELDKK